MANQQLTYQLTNDCLHGIYSQAHLGKLYTLEESVDCLLHDGMFPPIVDLTIRGSLEERPLVVWIPSGHPKVHEIEDTWNEGFGPFKPMGLLIPSHLGGKPPLSQERMGIIGNSWHGMAQDAQA
jgi:hypothetical protein